MKVLVKKMGSDRAADCTETHHVDVGGSDAQFSSCVQRGEGQGERRRCRQALKTLIKDWRHPLSLRVYFGVEDGLFTMRLVQPWSGLLTVAFTLVLAGCAVGPDYKRPAVNAPTEFRAAASDTNPPPAEPSFGDVAWWDTFNEPQLKVLIAEALTNSFDVQIAAARVLQAEASLRITRSQFFPTINAGGDYVTQRTSEKSPAGRLHDPEKDFTSLSASMPA